MTRRAPSVGKLTWVRDDSILDACGEVVLRVLEAQLHGRVLATYVANGASWRS
jgi:hypothetical protein